MPAADWSLVLARFGELGIKGPETRARFARRLQENLEEALASRKVEARVEQEWGRFYLHARDVEGALDALRHTFGFVSASPAEEVGATIEAVAAKVREEAPRLLRPGRSFAIRARRSGTHPFTSMDLAKACGDAAWSAVPGLSVDLRNPDVEIHVEMRQSRAFVFTRTVACPGGLPVGTQGRVVVHVASNRDLAAAWLLFRRGCTVELVLAAPARPDLQAASASLRAWWPRLRIVEDEASRVDALRSHARRRHATCVAVGEGFADAASFAALDGALPVPVLRPLAGWFGDRLARLSATLGFAVPEEGSA